jgi:hypothetical protein
MPHFGLIQYLGLMPEKEVLTEDTEIGSQRARKKTETFSVFFVVHSLPSVASV